MGNQDTARAARGHAARTRGGVHALVATGSSPAGRRTLAGELVWVPLACGGLDCSCTADFTGVVTRGITDLAEVRVFRGTIRSELRRAIAAGMCRDCVPPALAAAEAERLLRAAERLPEGALVRRDAIGAAVRAGRRASAGGPAAPSDPGASG